jgi:hypothetical protein
MALTQVFSQRPSFAHSRPSAIKSNYRNSMSAPFNNEFQKKRKFLLQNENYFLNSAALWHSFTLQQLRKYQTILPWNFIVNNTDIKWNIAIVDEFRDEIFTDSDSCFEFSFNDSLPWSTKFIKRYENLWNWESLAQNNSVIGKQEITDYFYDKFQPYYESYKDAWFDTRKRLAGFGRTFAEQVEDNLNMGFFRTNKELQFQYLYEIENARSINWRILSSNSLLPWSAELIEKYIDKWHWSELSKNVSIRWDLELMKRFEHRIDWTIDTPCDDGCTTLTDQSISSNFSIQWDAEILSTFLNKLDTNYISGSPCVKWDIDLLIQFNEFWDLYRISWGSVWNKVFFEFNNEEHFISLLDLILEKKINSL